MNTTPTEAEPSTPKSRRTRTQHRILGQHPHRAAAPPLRSRARPNVRPRLDDDAAHRFLVRRHQPALAIRGPPRHGSIPLVPFVHLDRPKQPNVRARNLPHQPRVRQPISRGLAFTLPQRSINSSLPTADKTPRSSPRQPRAGGFRLGRPLARSSSPEGGPIARCVHALTAFRRTLPTR
jgi:hypothetical protein